MTVLELHAGHARAHGGAIHVTLAVLAGMVATLGLIAVISAGFALSFDAIGAVATAAHVRSNLSWFLPTAIDGAMAVGTVAAVVLRRIGQSALYPWTVVFVNAGISVFCNALHAYMGQSLTLPPAIAMAVSAIPAVNLALSVHLLVLLVDAVATLLARRIGSADKSQTSRHELDDRRRHPGGPPARPAGAQAGGNPRGLLARVTRDAG